MCVVNNVIGEVLTKLLCLSCNAASIGLNRQELGENLSALYIQLILTDSTSISVSYLLVV
jgi:hypothetical protein